jgi:hypothetical protein
MPETAADRLIREQSLTTKNSRLMAGKRAPRGDRPSPRLGDLSLGDCRSGAGVIERRFEYGPEKMCWSVQKVFCNSIGARRIFLSATFSMVRKT